MLCMTAWSYLKKSVKMLSLRRRNLFSFLTSMTYSWRSWRLQICLRAFPTTTVSGRRSKLRLLDRLSEREALLLSRGKLTVARTHNSLVFFRASSCFFWPEKLLTTIENKMFPDIWLMGLIQSVVLRTRLIKLYFLYRSSSISRLANPPPSNILNGARLTGGEGGVVKALYVLFQLETYTLTFEMSVLVQKLSILLT